MPLVTRDEVKGFLNIASGVTTFDTIISTLIPVVTDRLFDLCNNPFTAQPLTALRYEDFRIQRRTDHLQPFRDTDPYVLNQVQAAFDSSARTITATGSNFASAQFASGQDFLIYNSYLNDGYYVVSSISTSVLTIATSYSFTGAVAATHSLNDEASGASIYFAVARWPRGIKPVAASLIQYDYQDRGSWSEDSRSGHGEFGYPVELLRPLQPYTVPGFTHYR